MASNPIVVDPKDLDQQQLTVDPSEVQPFKAEGGGLSRLLPDPHTIGAQLTQFWRQAIDAATTPLHTTITNALPEKLQPKARISGGDVVRPWTDLAQSGVEQLGEPFRAVPGAPWILDALESAIGETGKVAGGTMDFATSPAGIAALPLGGSANPLISGGTRAVFAGSMAPEAISKVREAAKNPSGANVGSAIASTAAAVSPVGPELAGVPRAANEAIEGGIERHNARAEQLVNEERSKGIESTEQGERILGTKSMPVKIGDRTLEVQPAGESQTGRPFYRVVDQDSGKTVYGGYGDAVQGYFRQRGARPLDEEVARYPESQPIGKQVVVDENAPSVRKMSAKASVPEEGASEHVLRVQEARERLSQDLAGKPFGELSNPERLVVDHFVTEGYGFASKPEEPKSETANDRLSEELMGPGYGWPSKTERERNADQRQSTESGSEAERAGGEAASAPRVEPEQVARVEPAAAESGAEGRTAERTQPGEPEEVAAKPADNISSKPESGDVNDRFTSASREPSVKPAYGSEVAVAVPGEATSYPARYAIREAADVVPSHNPQSFEANPDYDHQNDRDYSDAANAARVVQASSPGEFKPEYTLSESPTAEHGAPVIDQRGNALGGNNRTMTIQRVYAGNGEAAQSYRQQLAAKASQFGIAPSEIARFRNPVLVRELRNPVSKPEAQLAITDFNKTAAAQLSPAEQAVTDGKRITPSTARELAARIEHTGEDSTLGQALQGENGGEVLNQLVDDGVFTRQEANGLVDERGFLTPEAKHRIGTMIVGRLFESPKEFNQTPAELRAKLERIAPHVLRVESREGWGITPQVRQAIGALSEARAHGIRNLSDLASQQRIEGSSDTGKSYTPEVIAIAKRLQENPTIAAKAFRQYANDEALSRPGAQTSMFEPPSRAEAFHDAFVARAGERGAARLGAITLGLDRFVMDDVAPAVGAAAEAVRDTADDILKILAPAARGRDEKTAALIMRGRLAELARRSDQAEASLAKAKKFFDGQSAQDNYEFINRMETAAAQKTADLDAIAKVFRTMMDSRRAEVQALGKGKLQQFYENYFPHVWQRRKAAQQVFASFFGRRPLEGGKAFLKQRKYPTFADGLSAGLKPLSDNPVDLVVLKSREIDRYLMAHQILEDWKASKLAKFVDARRGKGPSGWMKIDDPIGTVYGQSVQAIPEYPNEGIYEGLAKVASAVGIQHKRGFKIGGDALGYAQRGGGIRTRHGTAEDVLAHEIGHQLEWKYGLSNRLMKHPDTKTRVAINRELRALADLRKAPLAYRRNRDEKMAAIAQAWVGARDAFKRVAPTVYGEWTAFLGSHPELAALRNIEGSMNHVGLAQGYDVGGLVIKGHWWAPEGAARIMNNYLTPGLRAKGGYRALIGLNNVLNQFQLGLSAFHLGFTSADAAVSKAALGFEGLMRGKPVAAAKSFAGVPAAPFTTFLEGNRVLKEWYKPGAQGGAIGKIVDGLVAAGGRAHMDEFYQTRIADAMKRAWRHRNWFGALVRSPFAAVEKLSDVMMREIVPRQKLGVFADLARFEMERLGPGATFEETRAALAKAWDSVENRMGQMTYDNLFWNRTAKDIAMLGVRSVGWNLGTLREIGGGAIDLIKEPIAMAGGRPARDVSTHRIAYLMGLVTVSAIMGALYQYFATGKGPEEAKDYFFPKTGQLDEAGRPQRASLPTYVKDVYHYATEPGKTLAGKVAPIWSTFAEMIRNEDFYGNQIRNADDPLVQQLADEAKHAVGSFEPFGARNIERQLKLGASPGQAAQSEIGITPAPAALEKTRAERLAAELSQSSIPAGGRTKEQAERRDAEHEIARRARAGQAYAEQARDYIQRGVITTKDLRGAIERAKLKPLAAEFQHMSLPDALKVWAVATEEERRQLRPLLVKKARALRNEPAELERTLAPKVQAALSN